MDASYRNSIHIESVTLRVMTTSSSWRGVETLLRSNTRPKLGGHNGGTRVHLKGGGCFKEDPEKLQNVDGCFDVGI